MNLNRIFKNRTAIGILCIALSLSICFGLTPLFNNALKSQTEIIRVTKDIKKGEVFTSGNTEKVKVGAFNLPDNAIKKTGDVMGKYAVADLMKGDFVLAAKLTNKLYEENEYLYKLDEKKMAISLSIKSFALGLSGKLKSGDIVSIIAADYGDTRQTFIPPELQYVEVLAVTTAKGTDGVTQTKNTGSTDEQQLPSTVTLLADSTQAKILADLEKKCKIHISLVYRGDEVKINKFLQEQDKVLGTMDSLKEQSTSLISSSAITTSSSIPPTSSVSVEPIPIQDSLSSTPQKTEIQGGVSYAK